jgi:biopolymer transport protein ExbD
MRRCSRPVHYSLTQLNITPLLDLGFVLLVIFILTTTPIINDLELNLPSAGRHPKEVPRKANYVTIEPSGTVLLNKKQVALNTLRDELVLLRMDDPDLNVIVRGDRTTRYKFVVAVMDALQQANVARVELATEPGDT